MKLNLTKSIIIVCCSLFTLNANAAQVLYGLTSQQDLYIVNTSDGTLEFVGSLGLGMNYAISMTADQTGTSLLFVDRLKDDLLNYDLSSGNIETITSIEAETMNGMSIDSQGVLYGVDATSDDLATYDILTGKKNLIGSIDSPY